MNKLLFRSLPLPEGGPGLARGCGAGFLHGDDVPGVIGAGQQCFDAQVEPDGRPRPGVLLRNCALHLGSERHEPPLRGAGDGGAYAAG